MRSLFWEIFSYFWVALVLSIVTTAWLTSRISNDDEIDDGISSMLVEKNEQAKTVFAAGGMNDLEMWANDLHRPPELFIYLFDENGRSEFERDIPDNFRSYLPIVMSRSGEANDLTVDSLPSGQNLLIIGGRRLEADGSGGLIVLVGAIQFQEAGGLSYRNTLILRFVVSFIFVGVICLLLSRHLTRPLKQLQLAVRSFAEGSLGSEVNHSLENRKDEIGELGREFDAMAERIESLVSGEKRMLRDISHELRSPLARMQVALELAKNKTDGKDIAELDRIELETARLDDLIAEILALVRFDASENSIRFETVDLVDLLRTIADDARFEGAEVVLETNGMENAKGIADAYMIHSALENIVRNALQYTTDKVEINLERNSVYKISIRDFGPGVAEDQLDNLFEPFYRVEGSRYKKTGGYGLGLAIARRAIEAHGGEISAHNAKGGGLLIVATIPNAGGSM
jgi:two-component system sensor histidine kinase CpxA